MTDAAFGLSPCDLETRGTGRSRRACPTMFGVRQTRSLVEVDAVARSVIADLLEADALVASPTPSWARLAEDLQEPGMPVETNLRSFMTAVGGSKLPHRTRL